MKFSTAFDEIVKVQVGGLPTNKTFCVHKGVLRFYSGYFDRALGGSFLEAKNGVIKLNDEDPSTFEMFQYWLYTRRFHHVSRSRDLIGYECKRASARYPHC